jgi:hypothetical protein
MADQPQKGPTRVAVVLIHNGEKLLLVYNAKWRAFTLPMTKLPYWNFVETAQIVDPQLRAISAVQLQDYWLDAAAHAVVECLGQPNDPRPVLDGPLEVEYSLLERSWRDGAERFYQYKLFDLKVAEAFQSRQQPSAWLSVAESRDPKNRPISPTVREILGREEVRRIVEKW